MRLTTLIAAAAVSAVSAVSGAQMDLTSLPPEPGEYKEKLESCSSSLSECVAIAEKETGGVAAGVEMILDSDSPQAIVTLYTDAARHEVTVNAMNGSVLKKDTSGRFPGWALDDQKMHTTDSGLMYFVVEEGSGAKPADATAKVEVHYTGYFVDGNKFDSSVDRGQTATFGLNQVISGWTEGVGMMTEGAKWKLVIPGKLAYGPQGRRGAIPPNAMLVFDVELVKVVSGAE